MIFTIVIHTNALELIIKSYTSVKLLKILLQEWLGILIEHCCYMGFVMWRHYFMGNATVCTTIYYQNGEKSMTKQLQERKAVALLLSFHWKIIENTVSVCYNKK